MRPSDHLQKAYFASRKFGEYAGCLPEKPLERHVRSQGIAGIILAMACLSLSRITTTEACCKSDLAREQ